MFERDSRRTDGVGAHSADPEGLRSLRSLSEFLAERSPSVHIRVQHIATSVSITLVVVGASLATVGVWGDSRGWWEDQPFLTNLVSTVVGACFGLPLVLVALRRMAEARDAEVADHRDSVAAAVLCQRMVEQAEEIERYWIRLAADDRRRPADDDWALFIAEILRLEGVLSKLNDHIGAEIAEAVEPLADRFRAVGLGGVQNAAREVLKCWTRLEALTGPMADLRDWEREWAPTRAVDARTFDAVLAQLAGASSHVWCDFFARLPRNGAYDAETIKDVRHNLWRALRFVFETGVVLARVRGADSLPPYWRDATDAYNDRLATQYYRQPLDQEPSAAGGPPTAEV